MTDEPRGTSWGSRVRWLQVGIGLSALTLVWLGYHAIGEWQRSAAMLAQRRAEAAVDLLVLAITRDMRGVQGSVLPTLRYDYSDPDLLLDINTVGSAFARYPYPEAFFATRGMPATQSMTFYGRSERWPEWLPTADDSTRFPVGVGRAPLISRLLIDRISGDVIAGRRFATFDVTLNRHNYQVVALLSYADPAQHILQAIVGFMVNLDWVRQHYFQEIVAQIVRMQGGEDAGVTLAIADEHDSTMVGTRSALAGDEPTSRSRFSLLFFDPVLVALDPPADLAHTSWTAAATVAGDRALVSARLGARQTLMIAAISGFVLAIGTVFTIRASRANTRLMAMRSDFVSAVTHELKTPIATIRAVSETVATGRSNDPRLAREYAQLAVNETKRLTRLIDNLLAYARITDITDAYSFEPIEIAAITSDTLKEFESQLATADFSVVVSLPPDLPPVRADRASMVLATGNVVDNAIRYANGTRRLTIAARAEENHVILEVSDAGRGIPPDEIPYVTRKFFRGHDAASGGSGLGLSIVQRIVSDHGGALSIQSEVDVGTTVTISLPRAEESDDEEADLSR